MTPSTVPLLLESVMSVTHALNAASLAVDPKNVITASRNITRKMAS